jgi:glycosyltransferase involved in cell wall biosynthesis
VIHFLITWSNDPSQSPLAQALRDLGVPHRLIAGEVLLRYRHRVWLLLVGLPRLLRFALRSAWRSLVRERQHPDAVVAGSHLEAMVFALAVRLLRRRTRVYLLGFIFTRRANAWVDRLRRAYFGVFCHSTLEAHRYDALFPAATGKFVFVPYGLHIDGYDRPSTVVDVAAGPALSAGRSGRDYPLLTRVFADSGRPLRIVCDAERTLAGCIAAPNITILRHCYDDDYVRELRGAGVVVVPLAVDDISAGQMVILQAMAYRKPIIATRTAAIDDYLTDGVNALLVPPGDGSALQAALDQLATDPALATRLRDQASVTYVTRHSMRAFVQHVVQAVNLLEASSGLGTAGPRATRQ